MAIDLILQHNNRLKIACMLMSCTTCRCIWTLYSTLSHPILPRNDTFLHSPNFFSKDGMNYLATPTFASILYTYLYYLTLKLSMLVFKMCQFSQKVLIMYNITLRILLTTEMHTFGGIQCDNNIKTYHTKP